MLVTLSAIASEQSKPTDETMNKCKQFLNYVATHPNAIITFIQSKSDMVLAVSSNAHRISSNQKHEAEQKDISTCQTTRSSHQTKWSHLKHCTNHQISNDISSRSRNGSIIYQRKRDGTYAGRSNSKGGTLTRKLSPRPLTGGPRSKNSVFFVR